MPLTVYYNRNKKKKVQVMILIAMPPSSCIGPRAQQDQKEERECKKKNEGRIDIDVHPPDPRNGLEDVLVLFGDLGLSSNLEMIRKHQQVDSRVPVPASTPSHS